MLLSMMPAAVACLVHHECGGRSNTLVTTGGKDNPYNSCSACHSNLVLHNNSQIIDAAFYRRPYSATRTCRCSVLNGGFHNWSKSFPVETGAMGFTRVGADGPSCLVGAGENPCLVAAMLNFPI